MDDGTGPLVVRSEFSTTDTGVAEEFLRHGYADSRLTITGFAEDFTFTHSGVAATGFSVNRLQVGVDLTSDIVTGPGDPFTVIQPLGGRFAYVDSPYDEVHVDTGSVALLPPVGPMRGTCEPFDLAVVQLDRSAVAAYAAATTGIDADDFAFEHIEPVTPGMGRYWAGTAARIRGEVLNHPWAAANPIVLDQAFRTLAAALLSTFPNTALARVTDPGRPPARGDVPAATLREVVDHLDSHADTPVGPVDVAALAGMSVREVVDGLRRRHGRHPAELLWLARLRGARRDLLDADPASSRVSALAARWGFVQLGRFRVAYLQAFDETPEQTLRR